MVAALAVLCTAISGSATISAQGVPPEIAELRRRVSVMRTTMQNVTAAAEFAAATMTRDTTLRFLISRRLDPGTYIEFLVRAGGPPDTKDADDLSAHGVVIMPVRNWDRSALTIAMQAENWRVLGRAVITIGPSAGRPALPIGDRLVDNGAPDGGTASADINGVANIIALWTFYSEFVAAASRLGWRQGIYLSDAATGGDAHNREIHFRMPDGDAVTPVAAGQLGLAYLAGVESLLDRASDPRHQEEVVRAADSLRAWRKDGTRLLVASCGHYLLEEIPRQKGPPFRAFDWRWDPGPRLREAGVTKGDAMLWFGYAGYDCPHAPVAAPFSQAGLKVIVVSDRLLANLPDQVRSVVRLGWPATDAVVPIPFPPGVVAPTSSVDMALHYLWLRRLVADSTRSTSSTGGH